MADSPYFGIRTHNMQQVDLLTAKVGAEPEDGKGASPKKDIVSAQGSYCTNARHISFHFVLRFFSFCDERHCKAAFGRSGEHCMENSLQLYMIPAD